MIRKRLILMVGLPRSGKTTLVQTQLEKGSVFVVVSPDAIRDAVHNLRFVPKHEGLIWWVVRIMVEVLFVYHETVVLDSCAITKARRDYWKDESWDTFFVVVKTPPEECLLRAGLQGDGGIIRPIEKMAREWEDLTKEESFNALDPESAW